MYEKPQENRAAEEEQEPKEKNMKVFYKLNINDNTNITSAPYDEEYDDQNYEAIKNRETALWIYVYRYVVKEKFV